MKIVHEFPPNIEEIRKVFPLQGYEMFAYGDTIYHPEGTKLPQYLIDHEEVHEKQQGDDVEGWWARYLVDPKFRFEMELEAHRAEYRSMIVGADRRIRRFALKLVAKKLAAPLYGRLCTLAQAKKLLKEDVCPA